MQKKIIFSDGVTTAECNWSNNRELRVYLGRDALIAPGYYVNMSPQFLEDYEIDVPPARGKIKSRISTECTALKTHTIFFNQKWS